MLCQFLVYSTTLQSWIFFFSYLYLTKNQYCSATVLTTKDMSKWRLKIQGKEKEKRERERDKEGETGPDAFCHSKNENVSLFALRLIYSGNHPSYAKCKFSVVEYLNHCSCGIVTLSSSWLLFSKKQIDPGSLQIILCGWGQDGRMRNPALLSSFC